MNLWASPAHGILIQVMNEEKKDSIKKTLKQVLASF